MWLWIYRYWNLVIMSYIKQHRRCNQCDERDSEIYVPGTATFNPLCCHFCSTGTGTNDGKPPCCYVAHFECPVTFMGHIVVGKTKTVYREFCDTFQADVPVELGQADGPKVFLRKFCEFESDCDYFSIQS